LVLLFANLAPRETGMDAELILAALERARLCEIIAERSGPSGSASTLFLIGLLSNFDVILGIPMSELIRSVNVAPEVETALLGHVGPMTPYLSVASACVEGDVDRAFNLGKRMGIARELPAWHVEASTWARGLLLAG
jgi:EAL and modified HD-GYP domain-containing signal transduction protein